MVKRGFCCFAFNDDDFSVALNKYIDFVDSFPMNVAGKILKYKMREDAVKKLGLQKADSVVTA